MKQTRRLKRVAIAKPKKKISKTSEPQESTTIRVTKPAIHSLPSNEEMKRMPPEFFQMDALDLAPRLLGKLLRRDDVLLQITEVEAYRPNDSACHARFGFTPRTAPLFGQGGRAYVYLCYGLHTMLNVVADKEGLGAAVLIRACAPLSGLKTIQQRRGQITEKPVLLTGPGKPLYSTILLQQHASRQADNECLKRTLLT